MAHIKTIKSAKGVIDSLLKLNKLEVAIGIPASKNEPHTDDDGGSLTNAELGAIHEYGSPRRNIPPRPFLAPGMAQAEGKIKTLVKQAVELAQDNKDFLPTLNQVALVGQNSIKGYIRSQPPAWPALNSIYARSKKKRTKERILIVSGQLLNSIHGVVRDRSK